MTWDDVSRFLVGSIPRPKLHQGVSTDCVRVSPVLTESLRVLNAHFSHRTELEVMQRVIAFVMDAASSTDDLKIQLQPSLPYHPTVTDVLITSHNAGAIPLAFIEVKKTNLSTHLCLQTDATAQALREAHILMQGLSLEAKLPFILTNSLEWSFGLAQKCGLHYIRILECFDIHIPMTPKKSEVKYLVALLRKVLCGTWVSPKAAS